MAWNLALMAALSLAAADAFADRLVLTGGIELAGDDVFVRRVDSRFIEVGLSDDFEVLLLSRSRVTRIEINRFQHLRRFLVRLWWKANLPLAPLGARFDRILQR